jgi:hypothetical protein
MDWYANFVHSVNVFIDEKRFFYKNGCLTQHILLQNQSVNDDLLIHNLVILLSANILSVIGDFLMLKVCSFSDNILSNQWCGVFIFVTFHFHYKCDE